MIATIIKKFIPLAALISASASNAQEKISPEQLYGIFKDFPIQCVVQNNEVSGCASIDSLTFLTKSKGLDISTIALEIETRSYLRFTVTQPFKISSKGICTEGADYLDDTVVEIVNRLNYEGNFRRELAPEELRDVVQKQFLNPIASLIGSSTVCVNYYIPEERAQPNELEYKSVMDGEVIDEGVVRMYKQHSASQLKLTSLQ